MTDVVELCCKLIEKSSVTPEDAGCQELMKEILAPLGFHSTTLQYEDVTNLWSCIGQPDGPLFVFAGHTDVVPSGNTTDWDHDPFKPTIVDGQLYGRGTADMKGSLAAMVVATQRFIKEKPDFDGRIGYLITSDEEGPAINGTVKVMEYLKSEGIHIDYCLVGEPSSTQHVGDVVKVGRRGSLSGYLKVKGIQGHVAYPHLARNPVHQSLVALKALCDETWDEGNAYFPPTTFQIANANAGTGASNVIPGDFLINFNFRFSTENSESSLKQRVLKILDEHDLEYEITWSLSGNPFLTEKGELIASASKAIAQVTGKEPELSTSGGTSDGRFIAPYGVQVIELGPTNATIHKVNENTNVAELYQLVDIYYQILVNLFSGECPTQ
ncbi:MAG: succinyl-diaminopimelate desuccinylase [Kangiellaceae bacterium]|nr:succinyl-diaminopimelate desuccinylase [Kangiellaceae bacterium]|tara:strand:+ start:9991 stop:11139 length:1149 start_codon:yes stop_codon:yes gene_type:complete